MNEGVSRVVVTTITPSGLRIQKPQDRCPWSSPHSHCSLPGTPQTPCACSYGADIATPPDCPLRKGPAMQITSLMEDTET